MAGIPHHHRLARLPAVRAAAGLLLVAHGLLHARAGMRVIDAASGLIPGPHGGEAAPWVAAALWSLAAAGFVAAGLGVLRAPPFDRRPRTWVGGAAAASLAFFGLHRPDGAALGAGLDVVVLALLAATPLPKDARAPARPGRRRPLRILAGAAAVALVAHLALVTALRPWTSRWGSTRAELRAALPGDELLRGRPATYAMQHAVTIRAPADSVWPWLAQIGHGRGGFYSYDRLERALGFEIRNADRVHPEWQTVAAGDTVFAGPGGWLGLRRRPGWRVARVDPGRALSLDGWGTFVLIPIDERTTRLVVRTRGSGGSGFAEAALAPLGLLAFEPVHFAMERRMLLSIRRNAEGPG